MNEHYEVEVNAANHFAWIRTRMGLERTLMAWVRTAASLIGFGFTIVQFFDRLADMTDIPAKAPQLPRYLGLGLIAVGIGALAVSAWQYQWTVRYLRGPSFAALARMEEAPKQTPILIVVYTLLLIGLFAFASVAFRLF
jgi:inner membrane protein YidH